MDKTLMINSIAWILSHFSLVLLIAGVFCAFAQKILQGDRSPSLLELLYRWIAFLGLGINGCYTFVMHGFFPDFTAATIGWQNSPFQYEVAIANLALGLLGLLSFYAGFGFRLAALLGNTCWLWGDAFDHIYQMIAQHNFTLGNAGSWFWMDICIPIVLWICLIIIKPIPAECHR